ncbi:protein quiver-like [Mya arenaria]|uniref:protein quiver-like n=1 Tax=Mya arenaria TaxID=6604 RepID=UPI0022E0FD76|nr:protein quiver-like [Mya arenaria]
MEVSLASFPNIWQMFVILFRCICMLVGTKKKFVFSSDMCSTISSTFGLVLFLMLIKEGAGLECYQCSSLTDPKCGVEWEVEGATTHRVQCPQAATACQKIVSEIQGSGEQHVYRLCWEQATLEPYTHIGCVEDEIRGGHVCRCLGDACNSAHVLHGDWILAGFGLVSSIAFMKVRIV